MDYVNKSSLKRTVAELAEWQISTPNETRPEIFIPILDDEMSERFQWAALKNFTPFPLNIIFTTKNPPLPDNPILETAHGLKVIHQYGASAGRLINHEFAASRADYLLILSPDVIVTPNWLTHLSHCAARNPRAAVVGPVSNISPKTQQMRADYHNLNEELFEYALQLQLKQSGQDKIVTDLGTSCLLIQKWAYETVGGFGGEFQSYAFVQDFLRRCRKRGLPLVCALDCYVYYQQPEKKFHDFAESEIRAVEYVEKGDQCLRNKELKAALNLYSFALQEKPDYSDALLAHTSILAQQGKPDEALRGLKKLTVLRPDLVEAFNNLGYIQFNAGKFADAEKSLIQAMRLNPSAAEAAKNLAKIYLHQKRYPEALEIYQQLISRHPRDVQILVSLGNCNYWQRLFSVAKKYYEQALQVEPENKIAQKNLALTNIKLNGQTSPGKDSDQKAWLEESLQIGIQHAAENKFERAQEIFKKIISHQPDHVLALHNLALVQHQLGETQQSIQTLKQVLQVDSAFPQGHNSLGLLYFGMENYTTALTEFKQAISLDINYDEAYFNYQATAHQLGISVNDTETDLVFYTAGIVFNGRTIYEKGLGGSESALFYLAREFANLGYKVRVFNNCDQPGNYEAVEYGDMVDFHIYRYFNPMKILISLRSLKPFKVPVDAKCKILWVQDNPNVEYLQGETLEGLDFDRIFTLSQYQTNEWKRSFNIPAEKFYITKNGVDLAPFAQKEIRRNRHKLIYSSRPGRGLDVLLDIFPRIHAAEPDTELHLFTYALSAEDREMEPFLERMQQPGVILRGSVSKATLAQEMLSARLMVYPTTFRETSCISVIEAQAAGLPIITSNLAVMPETISNGETGILLDGDPHCADYQRRFIEKTLYLLRDDAKWQRFSDNCKQRAQKYYDWKIIARDWEKELRIVN